MEAIAGKAPKPLPFDTSNVPGCTYSHPQIASVGLTETEAKAAGHKIKVGKFPFMGNGKAIALGAGDGLIKTILDEKTGELLGAHMIGETQKQTYDRVILAVGIVGNVENLGLEELGVVPDRTHIKTDGYGRTGVSGLYAIGDLTGPPWLAHKASHEGVICVEAIAGKAPKPLPFDTSNVPGCTYSHPQIASVGLTETEAKAAGHKIKVGKFPFMGNGKAIALGAGDGLIKTIFDEKTGELLGAHMIGDEVTELIQGYVIARQGELVEQDLMHTIFAHPSLSEMMHESVLAAFGKVLHI